MPIRNAAQPAISPHVDRYEGLLRVAEAHPDEVFTMDGQRLASLIRDLQAQTLAKKRTRPHA